MSLAKCTNPQLWAEVAFVGCYYEPRRLLLGQTLHLPQGDECACWRYGHLLVLLNNSINQTVMCCFIQVLSYNCHTTLAQNTGDKPCCIAVDILLKSCVFCRLYNVSMSLVCCVCKRHFQQSKTSKKQQLSSHCECSWSSGSQQLTLAWE